MPSIPLSSSVAVAVAMLVAACATTAAVPAQEPPPRPTAAPAAPGAPPSTPPSTPAPAQESLLQYVPATAAAAVLLRHGAFELPERLLAAMPDMKAELASYLRAELGNDLTGVQALAAYSTGADPQSVTMFVHLPGAATPAGTVLTQYRGVSVVTVAPGLAAAAVRGGIAVGTVQAVSTAIDVSQGTVPSLQAQPTARLASLLRGEADGSDLVMAATASRLGSEVATWAQQAGIEDAMFSYGRDRMMLRLKGDREKLARLIPLYTMGVGAGLLELQQHRAKATQEHDVASAVGAIIALHGGQQITTEMAPRMEGDTLVSRYRVPRMESSSLLVSYVGVAAAVAIPAVKKYVQRSKSAEASANLNRIAAAARAYHEENGRRGQRFAFPASTPWTPAGDCCTGAGGQCAADSRAFSHPTWRALGFDLPEQHRYQYRFLSRGKGKAARFTVEARGDMDCNGTPGLFRIEGTIDADARLQLGQVEKTGEVE